MLTQHIYWNLDAFQDGVNDILGHHLQVDSSKVIAVDGIAIPTGPFIQVEGTPFDYRKEQKIGARWNDTINLCGPGCQGYDNAWVYDNIESNKIGTSLWSDVSGIRVDISTDQPAVQVYTSFWLNTTRKAVHGGPSLTYGRWSAVAIEQEGYIDAINTPEWGVDQICESIPFDVIIAVGRITHDTIDYPGKDFEWSSTYKFSVTNEED
ncbi:hypothetical protein C0992_001088 [Termitomyces sp. T32_za158]|nr:hypothetical protein C0992_001088 [Termitomyces sp. T32_za158]